jgi:hypothetical protein
MNDHYAAVLADLEQMKVDAEHGIQAIKRLIARAADTTAVSQIATRRDNATLTKRVIDFVESQQGKSCRAEEIREALGGSAVNMRTLRGTLARLAKDKKIGKYGWGRYRAARSNLNTPAAVDATAA